MRIVQLPKFIRHADAALCACAAAKAFPHQLLCFRLISNNVPDTPPRRSDPAVSDFDEPCAEEIGARFEQVGPEPAKLRIASFEQGGEGVQHGNAPVSIAVKKTTVLFIPG